jgi:hypothetical protein
MRFARLSTISAGRAGLACVAALLLGAAPLCLRAQQSPPPPHAAIQPPDITATATVNGIIADTDGAAIPAAQVALQEAESNATRTTQSDAHGVFTFSSVPEGRYVLTVHAPGFAPWKIKDVLVVHEGEDVVVPQVQLGVEAISTTVSAISVEDLAEQQITAEEHQRILAVLPNFYVSYEPDPAPLTRKQKFKLAVVVSRDPVTFFTTGVTAGIEQWQGDFAGYGQEFSGYAKRYAATYGDKLASTFLGAALLPSLLRQDPRYFYRGHGHVILRALYAISTVAVCKGDNGRWQPNYSNILGNLGAAGVSTLYYPSSDQHSVQVTVTNTLIGVAEGAIGTLFQEFLLRHLTHGAPLRAPAQP